MKQDTRIHRRRIRASIARHAVSEMGIHPVIAAGAAQWFNEEMQRSTREARK